MPTSISDHILGTATRFHQLHLLYDYMKYIKAHTIQVQQLLPEISSR